MKGSGKRLRSRLAILLCIILMAAPPGLSAFAEEVRSAPDGTVIEVAEETAADEIEVAEETAADETVSPDEEKTAGEEGSAAGEEAAAYEEPAAGEEATAYEEPAAGEEAAAYEDPAAGEEAAAYEEHAVNEEAAEESEPVSGEELVGEEETLSNEESASSPDGTVIEAAEETAADETVSPDEEKTAVEEGSAAGEEAAAYEDPAAGEEAEAYEEPAPGEEAAAYEDPAVDEEAAAETESVSEEKLFGEGETLSDEEPAESPEETETWAMLQEKITNSQNGDVITLEQDYTAGDGDVCLSIPNNRELTIDLNGHILNRNLSELVSGGYDGSVILVGANANLTINDSKDAGGITGGFAVNGGGIINFGTLTINGGYISGNRASGMGGGIHTVGGLNLYGGTIQNNSCGTRGGGVSVTIINGKMTMNIAGNPRVLDNKGVKDGETVDSNVSLELNEVMRVTGELGERANIYVSTDDEDIRLLTSGYSKYNTELPGWHIHLDNEEYSVVLINGEAGIGKPVRDVEYISYEWDGKLAKSELFTQDEWIAFPEMAVYEKMPGSKYVLDRDVTLDSRVFLQDDTWLILCDGCTLNVKGLYIPKGKTLTIYGQENGTGKLISEGYKEDIYLSAYQTTIVSRGAGIGTCIDDRGSHKGGNLVIHGGTIEATGSEESAGIGTTFEQHDNTIGFTMYNGTVTATGGQYGAGIGGGYECNAGPIVIYGGNVTATGGSSEGFGGAGIGSGAGYEDSIYGNAYDISIYGGNVTAKGAGTSAGIGGGRYGAANVAIWGGTVNASSSDNGTGIGGGSEGSGGQNSIIQLGYTENSKDDTSITASSYNGAVTIINEFKDQDNGFKFMTADPVTDPEVLNALKGATLVPTDRTITINGITGSFNDTIKLNYYFDIPDDALNDNGFYMTITNENSEKVATRLSSDAKYVEGRGYRFSVEVMAKEANDIFVARAFDGKDNPFQIMTAGGSDLTGDGVRSSLMQYCDWLAVNGATDEEKVLGIAAKDYCTAAQIYFDYHADGLSVSDAVNAVVEGTLSDYIAKREGILPNGVSIKGISAMLESDNTLRLYLKFENDDLSAYTFKIDGAETQLIQRSDGMYYIALGTGTYSNHLQDEHIYEISDGTNSYDITASVLTYARSCVIQKSASEKAINIGKTLYLYNKAAVEAFPPKQ